MLQEYYQNKRAEVAKLGFHSQYMTDPTLIGLYARHLSQGGLLDPETLRYVWRDRGFAIGGPVRVNFHSQEKDRHCSVFSRQAGATARQECLGRIGDVMTAAPCGRFLEPLAMKRECDVQFVRPRKQLLQRGLPNIGAGSQAVQDRRHLGASSTPRSWSGRRATSCIRNVKNLIRNDNSLQRLFVDRAVRHR